MEKEEYCGIDVEMPHLNIHTLKPYEEFLKSENHKNKLRFLQRTIFNTK